MRPPLGLSTELFTAYCVIAGLVLIFMFVLWLLIKAGSKRDLAARAVVKALTAEHAETVKVQIEAHAAIVKDMHDRQVRALNVVQFDATEGLAKANAVMAEQTALFVGTFGKSSKKSPQGASDLLSGYLSKMPGMKAKKED